MAETPEPIVAKSLLSKVKHDKLFGLTYNLNLYRGCQHGCIYCDSRSICYQLGDLSHIRYKSNALELLEKELRSKKVKGTIGFGSMNDPYMPLEKKMELTRKALELLVKYKFPLHLITKSDLVVRDVDLIKKIGQKYAAISFTITTFDDALAKIIEPNAPSTSKRFEAIQRLSENQIYCGITLMPILPYINDSEENLSQLVEKAKAAGAKYIIPFMGLTLREGSRDYFYQKLDLFFPSLKEKYIRNYGNKYGCESPNAGKLYSLLNSLLDKYKISNRMEFYTPAENSQLKLF
jgi:DNA repair photolyase